MLVVKNIAKSEPQDDTSGPNEWMFVAMVIDRLCFFIGISTAVAAVIALVILN